MTDFGYTSICMACQAISGSTIMIIFPAEFLNFFSHRSIFLIVVKQKKSLKGIQKCWEVESLKNAKVMQIEQKKFETCLLNEKRKIPSLPTLKSENVYLKILPQTEYHMMRSLIDSETSFKCLNSCDANPFNRVPMPIKNVRLKQLLFTTHL